MKKPGLIIAGTNSGCGKTTVTAGIIAALVKRGLKVQPYKVGPDYIDPMFHTFLAGRFSRNLDSWLLDEETVRYLYVKNSLSADIAVVEGVMGLYDGSGGRNEAGSTAHIAGITGLPVILVVNPEGMALSVAALVKGFMDFDRSISVRGVIFNNVNSDEYYRLLKGFVEENTGISALGYLRCNELYRLGERHLGLITADEFDDLSEKMDALRKEIEETVDLEALLSIAAQADTPDPGKYMEINRLQALCPGDGVRIAVAYDKAFCFYYRDNLELLEQLGAELVYFSPLKDDALPASIDGLYLGGGYPELYAGELAENTAMLRDIKSAVEQGLPVYAECGGLMYLGRALEDGSGKLHEMVGLIPGVSRMTSSLKRFGYVDIEMTTDSVLAEKGMKLRGHEFHYSDIDIDEEVDTCYRVTQKRPEGAINKWNCGYRINNLLAGYAHLHFWSNPLCAVRFVENCLKYKQRSEEAL